MTTGHYYMGQDVKYWPKDDKPDVSLPWPWAIQGFFSNNVRKLSAVLLNVYISGDNEMQSVLVFAPCF